MIRLSDLTTIIVPMVCIEAVYNHLRKVGVSGFEGVALWAGVAEGKTFEVKSTLIPEQEAVRSESGLHYTVSNEELHRINRLLYERKWTLVAQLHSHPGAAYHSDTDDAYAIITKTGGISIVIPDFAAGPVDPKHWAVYRLAGPQKWLEIPTNESLLLFKIID